MQHLSAEYEQLDHQRTRIEQILAQEIVSPAMQEDLERMLHDIARRLQDIHPPGGNGRAHQTQ